MKINLAFTKGNQIGKEDVERLLDPFGLKVNQRVFIKPNLAVSAKSSSGIVVDPILTGLIIDYLRNRGANEIFIGEGPVIGHEASTVFRETGYEALAREKGVKLVDLNSAARKKVKWNFGELSLPEIALDSFYVNIAKLKTHVQTTVTLTMKNQKGLLGPIDKRRFHRDWGLHHSIAHLAEAIKPDLAIVDGFIGLEGDGPLSGGKPKKVGALVAGDDVLAVDSACCRIIGFDPAEVLHLKYAGEIGVGTIIDKNSSILAEALQKQIRFQPPNEEFKKMGKLYSVRNPYACTGCGDAAACAIQQMKANPKYWPKLATVLAYRALFSGMVLLMGKNTSPKGLKGKKICIGDCTRDLAQENGWRYVPGCPPKPEDIAETMLE